MRSRVIVVGSGVSGITTATVLRERGIDAHILTRELPPMTTSSIPGALWFPFKAEPRERVLGWARTSYERYRQLASDPASGVCWSPGIEVYDPPTATPWWAAAVPEYRRATVPELPPGAPFGFAVEAPIIETPVYLPWLVDRLLAAGGSITRRRLDDWKPAFDAGSASGPRVVVNCAGLGARELARDPTVFPSRGQLVHLEAAPLGRFIIDDGPPGGGEISYVIPRRDAVVIGGTVEDGSASLAIDDAQTRRMISRAVALVPQLAGLEIQRSVVGLRPCRPQVRLEGERVGEDFVVHNYGHGGAGYTLSWGCAAEAADLVEAILEGDDDAARGESA